MCFGQQGNREKWSTAEWSQKQIYLKKDSQVPSWLLNLAKTSEAAPLFQKQSSDLGSEWVENLQLPDEIIPTTISKIKSSLNE